MSVDIATEIPAGSTIKSIHWIPSQSLELRFFRTVSRSGDACTVEECELHFDGVAFVRFNLVATPYLEIDEALTLPFSTIAPQIQSSAAHSSSKGLTAYRLSSSDGDIQLAATAVSCRVIEKTPGRHKT